MTSEVMTLLIFVTIGVIALLILVAWVGYERGYAKGYSNGIRDARIYKRAKMKEKNKKNVIKLDTEENSHTDIDTVRVVNKRKTDWHDYE